MSDEKNERWGEKVRAKVKVIKARGEVHFTLQQAMRQVAPSALTQLHITSYCVSYQPGSPKHCSCEVHRALDLQAELDEPLFYLQSVP